jgi:hypothetical protein
VGWRLLDVNRDVEHQHVVATLGIACRLIWCAAPCGCKIDSWQRYQVEAEMMFACLHTVLYEGSLRECDDLKACADESGKDKMQLQAFAALTSAILGQCSADCRVPTICRARLFSCVQQPPGLTPSHPTPNTGTLMASPTCPIILHLHIIHSPRNPT